MTRAGYTTLGWIVWRVARRVARRKLADNRVKLGAGATVALVVVAGIGAARAGGREE